MKNVAFNLATFFIPLRTSLNVDFVIKHMSTENNIFQTEHIVKILGETRKRAHTIIK